MLAIMLAAVLAAASAQDVLVTKDGTRITGSIVEESPTKGVTLKLEDGTLRRFDPDAIAWIERGAGAQQARPAEVPPAPGAAGPQAVRPPVSGRLDTVFLIQGGRVRGRVISELPGEGVTILLPDGTTRRYPSDQIGRIEYADGSVSVRREQYPPRPPPPPAGPPPGAVPVPPPAQRYPPILPVYASLGLGGIGFGGDMGDGVETGDVLEGQLGIWLEGGVRLTPAIGLGPYLDIGIGDAGDVYRGGVCSAPGIDCMSNTGKVGLLLRHTWGATSPVGTWLALGGGFAWANVSADDGFGHHDIVTYTGYEMVRLMGGIDVRSNPVFGVGFYGGVSWTTYTRVDAEGLPERSIGDRDFQPLFEGGVRFTLFP